MRTLGFSGLRKREVIVRQSSRDFLVSDTNVARLIALVSYDQVDTSASIQRMRRHFNKRRPRRISKRAEAPLRLGSEIAS
jgi:hypothetical protein